MLAPTDIELYRLYLQKGRKSKVYGKLRDHKRQFHGLEPSASSRDGIKRCQVCVPGRE